MPSDTTTDVETITRVEQFLYREARLLDERDFYAWMELLADDFVYWVPIIPGTDPEQQTSVVYDDRKLVDERVFRLLETPAHAQSPPSRTQHDITNVEVLGRDGDVLDVRCNLTVHEMRPGDPGQVGLGHPRRFAARCEYVLVDDGEDLRVRSKTCLLLDRDRPLYNLTFIL